MQIYKITKFFDRLMVSCAIFLILYAWINFYIRNLWTTFILAIIFSSAIVYVIYYLINKKQEKTQIKKDNIKEINLKFLAFKLSSIEEKVTLIKSILSLKYDVTIKNNEIFYQDGENRHMLIFACEQSEINNNDILNLISKHNKKGINNLDIVCDTFSSNINTNILKNLKVNLIDKTKLYDEFFQKSNLYPNSENLDSKITKLSFVEILKNMFIPRRAKSYFFCGLILIFSAIILPYFIYYLIMGTILLIFSVLCKILPKLTKNQ